MLRYEKLTCSSLEDIYRYLDLREKKKGIERERDVGSDIMILENAK